MVTRKLIAFVMLAVFAAACGASASAPAGTDLQGVPVAVEGGTYYNLSPAQLAEKLKQKDFFFVNTHIPYEGEIEPTDAFIAWEAEGPQRVSEYPADKAAPIVLYCRSGRMSAIVAEALVKAGYTHVWNLDGGMVAWEQAGFEVVHK